MKVAVIGTGISGLVTAHGLAERHDVHVFERDDRIGGHTYTIDVEGERGTTAVDTGFIVYNQRTYPLFCRLMDELGVTSRETDMSFSLSCRRTGLEWSGDNLNTLFAQRRNLLRPSFLAMVRDIVRFNQQAPRFLESGRALPLRDYLAESGYSTAFQKQFLLPLGAAIWSAPMRAMEDFPARTFIQFFQNHGFLDLIGRPKWRTICGGSHRYVERLVKGFESRIRTRCGVERVTRRQDAVTLEFAGQAPEEFDEVVFATHSDQALALLGDPTPAEQDVLGAIPYQTNHALLHRDATSLPHLRRAWASWNYRTSSEEDRPVAVTYWMNRLQGLDVPETYCVTLNPNFPIQPDTIVREIVYHHPLFTQAAIDAQGRHAEISGWNRTHYCGAYWRYGFHEDGVWSAHRVLGALREERHRAAAAG